MDTRSTRRPSDSSSKNVRKGKKVSSRRFEIDDEDSEGQETGTSATVIKKEKVKRFSRADKMKKAKSQRSLRSQCSMNTHLEDIEAFCKMIKNDKEAKKALAAMVNPAATRKQQELLNASR